MPQGKRKEPGLLGVLRRYNVSFKRSGNGIVIVPPELTPDDYQLAYVFKYNLIY